MHILYIGNPIDKIENGAAHINWRNQLVISEISGNNVSYLPICNHSVLYRYCFGLDNIYLQKVKQELDKNIYDYVFISHSSLGKVCKYIKRNYPNICIITFFHNIEIHYAHEYLKSNIRALFYYIRVKYWEKITCQYTDKFITLNHRDSCLLKKVYNKQATIQLPTSFVDRFNLAKAQAAKSANEITFLFVGVSFFPNIKGVQWLLDNVIPHVNGTFYIVGKGMDNVPFKNLNDRVKIFGFVEDLSEFYYRARCIVAPIFAGGGMKTKTAEALMYGKTIIGTSEAFEGYDIDKGCMYKCNTKEEFIILMNKIFSASPVLYINPVSRKLFKDKYSLESSIRIARALFDK